VTERSEDALTKQHRLTTLRKPLATTDKERERERERERGRGREGEREREKKNSCATATRRECADIKPLSRDVVDVVER
jgi:hypothetical protein